MSTENNKIEDLRDILFGQLRKLEDPNSNLDKELQRAEAMVNIGNVIVNTAKTEVDFMKVTGTLGTGFIPAEKSIGQGTGKLIGDGKKA